MVFSRKQQKYEYIRNRDKYDCIAITIECLMKYGTTGWKRRIITLNILWKYFILLATHYHLYQYSLQNIAMKNYLQFFSAPLLTGNPYGAFTNLQHLCKILGVSFFHNVLVFVEAETATNTMDTGHFVGYLSFGKYNGNGRTKRIMSTQRRHFFELLNAFGANDAFFVVKKVLR